MSIRIFCGCSPNGEDAESQAVLEYTLRKNTKEDLDITWMKLSNNKMSPFYGWNTLKFSTPFTPFRWCIPELCKFSGRAIYMDTDMICMSDIADLWKQNMKGNAILVQNKEMKVIRTCVSLWDCEAIRFFVPPLPTIVSMKRMRDAYKYCLNILNLNKKKVGEYSGRWNLVDLKGSNLDDPDLKMIHYSSIAHQPHLEHAIQRLQKNNQKHWYDGQRFPHWRSELVELFERLLCEAKAAGFLPENYEPKEKINYRIQSYKDIPVKGFS